MNETVKPVPKIKMTPIESSHLKAYGYDPDTRTLAIRFAGKGDAPGPTWHYSDVGAAMWAAFCDTDSKGAFFQRMIRAQPEKHPGRKVEPQA